MKKWKQVITVMILLTTIVVTSVQPTFAKETVTVEQVGKEDEDEKEKKKFRGWDDISKRDALDVYSMTNWARYSKELLFKRGVSKVKAVNLSPEVESLREQVKKILSEMDESYGIFPNEDYTELMLALIQVLGGASNSNDPANVVKYINPKLKPGMNSIKSIRELFKRLSAVESCHNEGVDLYKNDEKLQSVMQGVVFTPNYTRMNKEYSLENAKKYKEKFSEDLYGNPSADFAAKVSEHYSTTSVTGGFGEFVGGEEFDKATEAQKNLVNTAYNTPFAGDNLCATWVSNVFERAGQPRPGGDANTFAMSYVSGELKVGMLIATDHSGPTGASWEYGHIGIYIGDGKVMHNESSSTGNLPNGCTITDLDAWISHYAYQCNPKIGWANGIDLTK